MTIVGHVAHLMHLLPHVSNFRRFFSFLINFLFFFPSLLSGPHVWSSSICCAAAVKEMFGKETFMWLFDSFVKEMFGKKPPTILTSQDAAMAKALASQWPKTHYRLCVWPMYQNAAMILSDVFESSSSFVTNFSSCVYDHDDEDDFLNAWEEMLDKYHLYRRSSLRIMIPSIEGKCTSSRIGLLAFVQVLLEQVGALKKFWMT